MCLVGEVHPLHFKPPTLLVNDDIIVFGVKAACRRVINEGNRFPKMNVIIGLIFLPPEHFLKGGYIFLYWLG
jgi:hypothetical protein